MRKLQRCYQYRLRPTPEQEQQFRQWSGCRRFVWNHFLQRRKDYYQETGKTLPFTVMCQELTLLKQQEEFSFLNDCDSQALQQVLRDLCQADVNFFEGRARFPKRKSKRRTPNSFRIPQRVHLQAECVSIPKVGLVPVVLHRPLEGEIKSATIKQEPSGKWTITFVSHFEAPEIGTSEPQSPTGLDAGLESFLAKSDGTKIAPPKIYRKQQRKVRKAQRQLSRKQKGSRNRNRARKKISVVHARIRNQRKDWLHKHSRELCNNHDLICVEDLAVSALTKTKLRGHSKSWNDAAWGTFRRQLEYKQEWQGKRLVERGVRFVQVFHGGGGGGAWDAHADIKANHSQLSTQSDQPIAALLTDLKQRGMLEETLVVWGTEFGRSPGAQATGRDHHPHGFSAWLAGGGIKGGVAHGVTDELGFHAVEDRHYVTDIHATILHQMGLDSHRLEVPGRKRLAIDHGQPITAIIA